MLSLNQRLFLVFVILFLSDLRPCAAEDKILLPFKKAKNLKLERQAALIARNALFNYLLYGKTVKPVIPASSLLMRPAGVFVTIVKDGVVRGCMGTVEPHEDSCAEEISRSAVMAATIDPWHEPVSKDELEGLDYIISVIGEIRKINSPSELNPHKLGLLIRDGQKSALLLPGEAKTPEWQIFKCKQKAGIPQYKKVEMFVFETVTLGPVKLK